MSKLLMSLLNKAANADDKLAAISPFNPSRNIHQRYKTNPASHGIVDRTMIAPADSRLWNPVNEISCSRGYPHPEISFFPL